MKRTLFSSFGAGLILLAAGAAHLAAAESEGLALAIVYDNSGSMKQSVRTATGRFEAKHLVANRALLEVVRRVESHVTNAPAGAKRNVQAGLFIFKGDGAEEAVKFGTFDAAVLREWVRRYPGPTQGTPLGAAIDVAGKRLLNSGLTQKHLLVITDGANTLGPNPATVVPQLNQRATKQGAVFFTHFVAFDIDAAVFAPLKKHGVTVVGAADEKQLNDKLEFILEEKILLEK